MKALRDAAKKDSTVKETWTDSVQTPMALLNSVFGRLSWNGNDIEVSSSNYVMNRVNANIVALKVPTKAL